MPERMTASITRPVTHGHAWPTTMRLSLVHSWHTCRARCLPFQTFLTPKPWTPWSANHSTIRVWTTTTALYVEHCSMVDTYSVTGWKCTLMTSCIASKFNVHYFETQLRFNVNVLHGVSHPYFTLKVLFVPSAERQTQFISDQQGSDKCNCASHCCHCQ